MKFEEIDLQPVLREAVRAAQYTECTPIQALAIPAVLIGKDISGLAQTGTGKTAAYVIPLIERILRYRLGETGPLVPKSWQKNSFVLVLVPTRELATQVEETVSQFGAAAGIRSTVIVGGAEYDEQRKALREGVEFVVGTPGRIIDLFKSHSLDLNFAHVCVFDEADRMFDMGFRDDMKFILKRVPRDRHFLLFSATMNFDVLNIAYEFGAEPTEINISKDQVTAEGIDHEILHIGYDDKPKFLLSILKKYSPSQCMVFTNYKFNCRKIATFLKSNGFEAVEMNSLLSQTQRNKVIESFKEGKKNQILVATDVAARGLDIQGVDLVVNYELPEDSEGYVHRIGRTGRAGKSGKAVGLVCDRDVESLARIEDYLKEKVKIGWFDDADIIKDFKPYQDFFVKEEGGSSGPRPQRRPLAGGRSGPPRGPDGPRRDPHPRKVEAPHRNDQPQRVAHTGKIESPRSIDQKKSGHYPFAGPSQKGQPIQKKETGVHGQTAQQGKGFPGHEHRDRKLGRHGRSTTAPVSENKRDHRHQKNAKPSPGKFQRRPLDRGPKKHSGPTKSISQKIVGFISKLFK